VERLNVAGQIYFLVRGIPLIGGANDGKTCDVAILRTAGDPWVPESVVHVKPHLVPMGQKASHPSPLGGEWQKLSRRFDKPVTPKNFLTHIYTVIGEI
jgi:hypothetical protein